MSLAVQETAPEALFQRVIYIVLNLLVFLKKFLLLPGGSLEIKFSKVFVRTDHFSMSLRERIPISSTEGVFLKLVAAQTRCLQIRFL